MIIRTVRVGLADTNCYVVGCEDTREGVVIDPGEWLIRPGEHALTFDCRFEGDEETKARIELRTREPAEMVTSQGAGE